MDTADIGRRARIIRRRRGLSLEVAAGLAGISTGFLSRLERGERNFERRGLLEDLAGALGCAVADLTGQPYLPTDRATADALAALPAISVALHDSTLTDAPDGPSRPVAELIRAAAAANHAVDETHYALAGRDLGAVATELHRQVAGGEPDARRTALPALAETCMAAAGIARSLGSHELATIAAKRAHEAAVLTGRPELCALTAMPRVGALLRMGARHRAETVLTAALAETEPTADPSALDTAPAEGYGMLHLTGAQLAARQGRTGAADGHLAEARELATVTGERNYWNYHFGPANVAAWSLAIAVETERGPSVAESLDRSEASFFALGSADRRAGYHLDLARAYAQAEGARDAEAIRHLDAADRIAPTRLRYDPIARDLVATLHRRARRRAWELDSLGTRFGVI